MKKYDAIIIGAGPAGIFCAMRLIKLQPKAKILLLDAGNPIEKRVCPVEIAGKCVKCNTCAITHGFAGAGAFSDCKLSLYNSDDTTFVGGELEEYLSAEELKQLIDEVVALYVKYGAPDDKIGGKNHPLAKELIERTERLVLELVTVPFMHTGTSKARSIFYTIEQDLMAKGVFIEFNSNVVDILTQDGKAVGVEYIKHQKNHKALTTKVVIATGRVGVTWNKKICEQNGISAHTGNIKIGVRYEVPDEVMGEVNQLYEPKFKSYATETTDAGLTFCHNPYCGSVVSESYDGEITLANGHADTEQTGRTNMALLFKMDLGENSIEVAKSMAKTINIAGDGQVIVQRFGDFVKNRPTSMEVLAKNSVQPTLKIARPGNLQLGMTPRLVGNIKDFIEKINGVLPGFAGSDNLLYGLEIKFSNYIIDLNQNFMTSLPGLYAIGDGAGLTNGLIQSSASGWLLGKILSKCDV